MDALVAAGAGFLLAVLWFDLMFDVQVLGKGPDVPEEIVASIAAYYRRVTTGARPMNRLVLVAMVTTLAGIAIQATRHDAPRGVSAASVVLAVVPIGLAGARTVPAAVRLGSRVEAPDRQRSLARSICRDHLFCVASIAALLAVQLVWA